MNERVPMPYGNAFIFETPHLDRAVNNLYVEQRQREANQQREGMALDAMVNKEFGKIRSVDTPEVINNYQQYKQLKKQLLFDPKIKRDPQLYNAVNRQAELALQGTMQGINRSQELLNSAKMDDQQRTRNPNLYDDNYGEKRAAFWKTPMSQLDKHPLGDLSNPDTYAYKGSNTDWQKITSQAIGQPKQVFAVEEPADSKGFQTKITPYQFGNTPAQVKEQLLGAMGMHKAGRDAEYVWDQIPQQEIERTIAEYKAIPLDRWQKMGLSVPQDLTPRNPQSKAEQLAAYKAMRYAIDNEPKQGTPVYRDNKEALRKANLEDWAKKEKIRQMNRAELVNYRHNLKQADDEKQGLWAGQYVDQVIEDGKNGKEWELNFKGNKTRERLITNDPVIAGALARQGQEPDRVTVTPEGKIRGIYFQYKKDKDGNVAPVKDAQGRNLIDETLSSELLEPKQLVLALSKKAQSAKQRAEEMQAGDDEDVPSKQATPKAASVDDIKKKFKLNY